MCPLGISFILCNVIRVEFNIRIHFTYHEPFGKSHADVVELLFVAQHQHKPEL